jgi:hypothetical protein
MKTMKISIALIAAATSLAPLAALACPDQCGGPPVVTNWLDIYQSHGGQTVVDQTPFIGSPGGGCDMTQALNDIADCYHLDLSDSTCDALIQQTNQTAVQCGQPVLRHVGNSLYTTGLPTSGDESCGCP